MRRNEKIHCQLNGQPKHDAGMILGRSDTASIMGKNGLTTGRVGTAAGNNKLSLLIAEATIYRRESQLSLQ